MLRKLDSNSAINVWEAAKELSNPSKRSVRLVNELIKVLKNGHRPLNRAASANALGFVGSRRAIPALEKTLANKAESRFVRSNAAEALAYLRSNRSIQLLTQQLEDPSKAVRFWCAFALGVAGTLDRHRAALALPALKRLARKDHRVVMGRWPVAKEAEWAAARIEGREEEAAQIEAEFEKLSVKRR